MVSSAFESRQKEEMEEMGIKNLKEVEEEGDSICEREQPRQHQIKARNVLQIHRVLASYR